MKTIEEDVDLPDDIDTGPVRVSGPAEKPSIYPSESRAIRRI